MMDPREVRWGKEIHDLTEPWTGPPPMFDLFRRRDISFAGGLVTVFIARDTLEAGKHPVIAVAVWVSDRQETVHPFTLTHEPGVGYRASPSGVLVRTDDLRFAVQDLLPRLAGHLLPEKVH